MTDTSIRWQAKSILLFILLTFLSGSLKAIPFDQNSPETAICLNGDWKFTLADSDNAGLMDSFFTEKFDISNWSGISVPSNWEIKGFEEPRYYKPDPSKVGLYCKMVTIPENWKNRQVWIEFQGVLFGYTLYVNGRKIGSHNIGFLGCQFDITNFIKYEQPNKIALKVYRNLDESGFDCNDDWALSGIYRDVFLFCPPLYHIDSYRINTTVLPDKKTAQISIGADIGFFRNPKLLKELNRKNYLAALELNANLTDKTGKTISQSNLPIQWGTDRILPQAQITIPVVQANYWTAENPYLYSLDLTLYADKTAFHNVKQKIGLRQVSIDNQVLKINGQAVKLRGVCRHEIHPDRGRALREQDWLQDIRMIKAANINSVRCSHYPPHPRFLELCDEYGLYVLDEVPIGFGDDFQNDPQQLDSMLARALLTIERDRNHPSVIIFDIGNENPLLRKQERAAEYVKYLDTSRPILYPGDNFNSNEYAKLTVSGVSNFVDIISKHYPSVDDLKEYAEENTGKPWIFTEINHSLDEAFENFGPKWDIIQHTPHFAGAHIWLWADQGIRRNLTDTLKKEYKNHLEYFLSGDSAILDSRMELGTDGIVYADRRPQTDYYQTWKIYAPVVVEQKNFIIEPDCKTIPVTIENRYDFTNLNTTKTNWLLTANGKSIQSGEVQLDCPPHQKIQAQIPFHYDSDFQNKLVLLQLTFTDSAGILLNQSSIRLTPPAHADSWKQHIQPVGNGTISFDSQAGIIHFADSQNIIALKQNGLINFTQFPDKLLAEGPFVRVGRRPTLAERMRYGSMKLKLWEPAFLDKTELLSRDIRQQQQNLVVSIKIRNSGADTSLSVLSEIVLTIHSQGTIDMDYSLTPESKEGAMLEFGLCWKIPEPQKVAWVGKGIWPNFPQKSELSEFGCWSVDTQNPFFSGNRMDVEAAVIFNKNKIGLAILCDPSNIIWDSISPDTALFGQNLKVASQGTKFTNPIEKIVVKDLEKTEGKFTLLPFITENNFLFHQDIP